MVRLHSFLFCPAPWLEMDAVRVRRLALGPLLLGAGSTSVKPSVST